MRFYPTADIHHYWEFPPGWSYYCHQPHKSWYRRPLQAKHAINYWRDFEGAKWPIMTQKNLYFKGWPVTRIRLAACLPLYYCVGNRFVRLERAFPTGFKSIRMPMNLQEVRELNAYRRQTECGSKKKHKKQTKT